MARAPERGEGVPSTTPADGAPSGRSALRREPHEPPPALTADGEGRAGHIPGVPHVDGLFGDRGLHALSPWGPLWLDSNQAGSDVPLLMALLAVAPAGPGFLGNPTSTAPLEASRRAAR
ncbi:hypothetical protein GCM10010266_27490 [Streptomyces griseomycini]|nr:hypothetical protein GCM10010266_27490 [Streptomyces griseomycini]GGR19952.1 hypothetical protein GCM10015536_27110 [Streptomyces griseomycini]